MTTPRERAMEKLRGLQMAIRWDMMSHKRRLAQLQRNEPTAEIMDWLFANIKNC